MNRLLGSSENADLKVVGLFSGIGGLELGFERAGLQTAHLCELMPEARAVLTAAMDRSGSQSAFCGATITNDVTSPKLHSKLPEHFDVLTAGFPCQDLSQAGRTRGINGHQSGLVGYVFWLLRRRAKKRRPTWIVLENVSFMRHLAGGHAMDYVLSELSELGYSWAYRELNTLAFGLPQRRKRLFIVGCIDGRGDPRRVLFDGDETPCGTHWGPRWRDGIACGFSWTEGNRGIGWADDAVPTLKAGSGLGIPSPPAIVLPYDGEIVLPSIRDAERLQGFPRGWTEAAGGPDMRSERIRWKLVGNAVSVPIAQWIGERFSLAGDPLPLSTDTRLGKGSKWPTAAWQLRKDEPRFVADIQGWPVRLSRLSLLDLLGEECVERSALSHKATKGFARRFEASNLLKRHPEHRSAFLEILENHVERTSSK